jgi:SAM-dependent methyltransferase
MKPRTIRKDRGLSSAVRKFPEGTSLEKELEGALKRVKTRGVRYPKGYLERLVRKYTKKGVAYPRILMRLGEPLILKHEHYKEVLKRGGKFLDFGCGTGDDVRQLIMDGFPRKDIIGFDIDCKCIDLGYDFYLDRPKMKGRFLVSKKPNFKDEAFDIVYSGSVLHTMHKMTDVNKYLEAARDALKTGGILFGSTLGAFRPKNLEKRTTFLTKKSFYSLLRKKGFKNIHIIGTNEMAQSVGKRRYWFYAIKEI